MRSELPGLGAGPQVVQHELRGRDPEFGVAGRQPGLLGQEPGQCEIRNPDEGNRSLLGAFGVTA
ncbi:hypothetical protein BC739_005690 [Kutzneria viridogrisea]|uniref:Uncharacterized protein n=2 Tax=Kutzneria TaxID=43356 RepID=W5W5X4_9PSEU|nr:hypothetical protein [Kutzneria albida]AHH96312.1 hypothetical protein KALB_2944 [Kutzneria albida DSM 43870]MBA8928473.1 hypothetical protein [Kutzneria viridogrisea]